MNNYNSELTDINTTWANWTNPEDWTSPDTQLPTYIVPPITPITYSTTTIPLYIYSTSTEDYELITSGTTTSPLYTYNTETGNYESYTSANTNPDYQEYNGGYGILEQVKNNANTLISSLMKSELAYQNNYMIAKNVLTSGKNVFATSSACNINYNRIDYVLRSKLIRANVITNIEGTQNSDRTIASIPWTLEVIKAALADSNLKITILNKATSDVSSASGFTAVTDAMIPVNSTAFNTDSQAKMVENIKTWLRGVQNMYNTKLCPIDLTEVLKITSATSTIK
jgi:hypothetical protein